MGLDTSHDAWHGAYSAFSRWRDTLAKAAGYEYATFKDNPGYPSYMEFVLVDWGHIQPQHYSGDWDFVPCNLMGPDPLLMLLIHSDCDGFLKPEHAALVADRLEELLPDLADLEPDGGHIGDWTVKTQQFIDGCRAAAAAGEMLEFF